MFSIGILVLNKNLKKRFGKAILKAYVGDLFSKGI